MIPMKSDLLDSLDIWEAKRGDLIWLDAQLRRRGTEIDLSYDEDVYIHTYDPQWMHDLHIAFGKLDYFWTMRILAEFRPYFFVVSVAEQAPHEGVACFRFADAGQYYTAKALLDLYK